MTFVPSYVDHRFAGVTRWFLANDCELAGRHIIDAFDRYATLGQRIMHIFWAIIAFLPIGGLFLSLKEERWAKMNPEIASNKEISRNYWTAHPKEREAFKALLGLFADKKITMHQYCQLARVGIPQKKEDVQTLFTLFANGKMTVEEYRYLHASRVSSAHESCGLNLEGLNTLVEQELLSVMACFQLFIRGDSEGKIKVLRNLNYCLIPNAPVRPEVFIKTLAMMVQNHTITVQELIDLDTDKLQWLDGLGFNGHDNHPDRALAFFRSVQRSTHAEFASAKGKFDAYTYAAHNFVDSSPVGLYNYFHAPPEEKRELIPEWQVG